MPDLKRVISTLALSLIKLVSRLKTCLHEKKSEISIKIGVNIVELFSLVVAVPLHFVIIISRCEKLCSIRLNFSLLSY